MKTNRLIMIPILALLTILFFFGGPGYYGARSYKAAWNLGHIFYFALLPMLVFSYPRLASASTTMKGVVTIGLALVIGTVVEIVQGDLNRHVDMLDIFRNLIGAMVAVFFWLPVGTMIPKIRLYVIRIVIVLLVLFQLYPIAVALIDEHLARRDFPILSDFQPPFQLGRWYGSSDISIADDIGEPGNRALRADLTTRRYSGARFKYFPGNWVKYRKFQFQVFNPSSEPLSLTCRIHDELHRDNFHDRFNRTYPIISGWNTIDIDLAEVAAAPMNRSMDLSRIRRIAIFAIGLPQPRTIYIDNLRLF